MQTREECLYIAKIADQIEDYNTMIEMMKKVISLNNKITTEERNLLSVAYKLCIGQRRSSLRSTKSLLLKQQSKGSKNVKLLLGQKTKIEQEMVAYCSDLILLFDEKMIQSQNTREEKAFLLKMKGDYYRYLSEACEGSNNYSLLSAKTYKQAHETVTEGLSPTHPTLLAISLNYSIYFYEMQHNIQKAYQIARKTFDEAIEHIDEIDDNDYRDSTCILSLIRDNLTLWTSELEEGLQN